MLTPSLPFDPNHTESMVSPAEHGKRLGLAILNRSFGDLEYAKFRGNLFFNLESSHNRAKNCPLRPTTDNKRYFRLQQVHIWLGYQEMSMIEIGYAVEIREKLLATLAGLLGFYAPFQE